MGFRCFILWLVTFGSLEARIWTDADGRKFEAQLVGRQGSDLIMELPGGKRVTVKLDRLSPRDRELAAGRASSGGFPSSRVSNLGWAWPREIRYNKAAEVKVVSEDRDKRQFVYESPHYRFRSNVRLTQDVLRSFSVMFETTHRYCASLPLSMQAGAGGGRRLQVMLFESNAQFVQAGGLPGSEGSFDPRRGVVLAPLSSLGLVAVSGGYKLDPARQNRVLIHELTHQLTPAEYWRPGALGWFSEGLAEYVATTPYTWGYFKPDPAGNVAKAYVTARGIKGKGGRALGTRIQAPSLRRLLTMPYQEFAGTQAAKHYGISLLLVHYFFHMDGQGRGARINAFLKSLNSGEQGDAALRHLLQGRSYEQLEKEISSAWRRKGVTLQFGS